MSCEIYNLYINGRVLWYLAVRSLPAPFPPLSTLLGWVTLGPLAWGGAHFSPHGLEEWFPRRAHASQGGHDGFGVWEEVTRIFI